MYILLIFDYLNVTLFFIKYCHIGCFQPFAKRETDITRKLPQREKSLSPELVDVENKHVHFPK